MDKAFNLRKLMQKITLFYICFFLAALPLMAQDIQDAELAGSWYSGSPDILRKTIENYLALAEPNSLEGELLALISPHAGIDYCGKVAAWGFKVASLKPIDLVIVVGSSHRMDYDGTAVFDKEGFKTPLGVLYTDKELLAKITRHDNIFADAKPFKGENSIELLLPFIQTALGNPKVLLLAMGQQSFQNAQILADALYKILKDQKNFLLIASTDLSHYLTQKEAEAIDAGTAKLIVKLEPEELFSASSGQNRMCGTAAVAAVEIVAKKLGADNAVILKQATSFDAGGDKTRVVGYLSAAFFKQANEEGKIKESEPMETSLNSQQKKELLKIARNTIDLYLRKEEILEPETQDSGLKETQGVFVTLRKAGELRGCIGNIIGSYPLYLGVRDMAIAAATEDPRFPTVAKDELSNIEIEISVLTPLRKITNPDEIILGTHGVLVKQGFGSGVFLPQVATETGWNKEQFMNSLCAHKAGIAEDAWKRGACEIHIFTAQIFSEGQDD